MMGLLHLQWTSNWYYRHLDMLVLESSLEAIYFFSTRRIPRTNLCGWALLLPLAVPYGRSFSFYSRFCQRIRNSFLLTHIVNVMSSKLVTNSLPALIIFVAGGYLASRLPSLQSYRSA